MLTSMERNTAFMNDVRKELMEYLESLDAPTHLTDIHEHFRRKWYDDKDRTIPRHAYHPNLNPGWGLIRSEALRAVLNKMLGDGVLWQKKWMCMLASKVKDDTGWHKGGWWD